MDVESRPPLVEGLKTLLRSQGVPESFADLWLMDAADSQAIKAEVSSQCLIGLGLQWSEDEVTLWVHGLSKNVPGREALSVIALMVANNRQISTPELQAYYKHDRIKDCRDYIRKAGRTFESTHGPVRIPKNQRLHPYRLEAIRDWSYGASHPTTHDSRPRGKRGLKAWTGYPESTKQQVYFVLELLYGPARCEQLSERFSLTGLNSERFVDDKTQPCRLSPPRVWEYVLDEAAAQDALPRILDASRRDFPEYYRELNQVAGRLGLEDWEPVNRVLSKRVRVLCDFDGTATNNDTVGTILGWCAAPCLPSKGVITVAAWGLSH